MDGVRRTRTLGRRSLVEPEAGLPPSKYSMSNEVCDLLALCRVAMVTGVPSSGIEYEDLPSSGFTSSPVSPVVNSVGVVLVVSVSVGAGSGRGFLEVTPIVDLVM